MSQTPQGEFFRKGGGERGLVKGKRWLLLTRWIHLEADKRRQLNELFALNRSAIPRKDWNSR